MLLIQDVLSMEGSLAHLALTNYPDQIEYIDKIMETTGDIISQYLEKKNFKSLPASAAAAREVINLIKAGFRYLHLWISYFWEIYGLNLIRRNKKPHLSFRFVLYINLCFFI